MKKWMLLTILILLAAGPVSCSGTNANSGKIDQDISIGTILKEPHRFQGSRLTIQGEFKGWKGSCFSAPPVSRSDWMLQEGKDCIYVTGPLPAGMDPVNPRSEKVEVNAEVDVDATGKAYLLK